MTHPPARKHLAHGQRGWSFLVILIALAIVAFLARDAIRQYFATLTSAPASLESRLPPAARVVPDPTQATPAPSAPIERARAVEDVLKQQHEQLGKRIDGAAR